MTVLKDVYPLYLNNRAVQPNADLVVTDKFTGQSRPLGEPGFGLPEIYALLGEVTGRHVPATDAEATVIQRAYRDLGPLPRTPTEQALRTIASELGKDRPIRTYLDALRRRVIPQLP